MCVCMVQWTILWVGVACCLENDGEVLDWIKLWFCDEVWQLKHLIKRRLTFFTTMRRLIEKVFEAKFQQNDEDSANRCDKKPLNVLQLFCPLLWWFFQHVCCYWFSFQSHTMIFKSLAFPKKNVAKDRQRTSELPRSSAIFFPNTLLFLLFSLH